MHLLLDLHGKGPLKSILDAPLASFALTRVSGDDYWNRGLFSAQIQQL